MASATFLRLKANPEDVSEPIFDRARAKPAFEVPRREDARGNAALPPCSVRGLGRAVSALRAAPKWPHDRER